MKTKLLITGFLLSALMIAGIVTVSADGTIQTMDYAINSYTCNDVKDEYDPEDHIFVQSSCDGSLSGGCWVWVCPCSFDDSTYYVALPGDTGCILANDSVPAGDRCIDLGLPSNYGETGECFDVIIDQNARGIYGSKVAVFPPELTPDGIDVTGATCADCVPTTSAGFHVTPEPAAIALFIAGLASLYGFVRIRRKK